MVSVLKNSFWIFGLAILLTNFSYHYWKAKQRHHSLRAQLNQGNFVVIAWLSFTMISVGLALTSQRVWEAVIWGIFTIIGLYYSITYWRVPHAAKDS